MMFSRSHLCSHRGGCNVEAMCASWERTGEQFSSGGFSPSGLECEGVYVVSFMAANSAMSSEFNVGQRARLRSAPTCLMHHAVENCYKSRA